MSHLKVKCRSVRAKCEKSGLEDRGVFFSPEICLHFVELYKMVEGPHEEMLKKFDLKTVSHYSIQLLVLPDV